MRPYNPSTVLAISSGSLPCVVLHARTCARVRAIDRLPPPSLKVSCLLVATGECIRMAFTYYDAERLRKAASVLGAVVTVLASKASESKSD